MGDVYLGLGSYHAPTPWISYIQTGLFSPGFLTIALNFCDLSSLQNEGSTVFVWIWVTHKNFAVAVLVNVVN